MDQIVTNSLSKSLLQDTFGGSDEIQVEPIDLEVDWQVSFLPQYTLPEIEEVEDSGGEKDEQTPDDDIPELSIEQIMMKELDFLTDFIDSLIDIGQSKLENQVEDVPDEDV